MEESILNSIKSLLNIPEDDETFDQDILIHINSTFAILNQLGVGPDEGFTVTDPYTEWSTFINDNKMFEMVKSYTYLRVRLLFDPPASGVLKEAIVSDIAMFEWRITVAADESKLNET